MKVLIYFMPQAKLDAYLSESDEKPSISLIVYDVGITKHENNQFSHMWCYMAAPFSKLEVGKAVFDPKIYKMN